METRLSCFLHKQDVSILVVKEVKRKLKHGLLFASIVLSVLAVNSYGLSAHATSLEKASEASVQKSEGDISLLTHDTYVFEDTNISVIKGSASIGSGNTAKAELLDQKGEILVAVPVDTVIIAGQTIITFHEEGLETERPATTLRITVSNVQGEPIRVIEKEMNMIYM